VTSASLIEKCCLIGFPVAGNPTHYIVEQAFAHKDLDWRFMTFEVTPEALGDAMRGVRALGFRGVKVAEPHQETVLDHVDELTDQAKLCGSVNCVTAEGDRLVGDNTEGRALVELVRAHVNLSGRDALVVGSGRLARAIAVGLAQAGVTTITVASRSEAPGRNLAELIENDTPASGSWIALGKAPLVIAPEVAVLVNATSASTDDPMAPLPLDLATADPKLVVADVAYNTARTWLTRQAAGSGRPIIDGVQLYVQHTAIALRTWTGTDLDATVMQEAAEEFLGV
jgi:shikimate dehydrogenase